MTKLLIAVDGSEAARHAIEAAARLAGRTAEVVLVNVGERPGYHGDLPPFDYESLEASEHGRQAALLEAAVAHARLHGFEKIATVSAVGPAAREISRAAADHAVDEIVMGTRGMNPLAGLLLGSVAQRVVHLAAVPVLLVK